MITFGCNVDDCICNDLKRGKKKEKEKERGRETGNIMYH